MLEIKCIFNNSFQKDLPYFDHTSVSAKLCSRDARHSLILEKSVWFSYYGEFHKAFVTKATSCSCSCIGFDQNRDKTL